MKKLETLRKEAEKMTVAEFLEMLTLADTREYYENILTEENFRTQIKANEIFSFCIYRELAKALNVKSKDKKQTFKLELDCNYEKSKKTKNANYDLMYMTLLDSDRKRAIQMYLTANVNKSEAYFRFCTSCEEHTRHQFEALYDELQFVVNYDKKTQRAKTSERKRISYNEVVEVAKLVLAVLNNELEATESEEATA
jgi:hypothetical protein